MQCYVSESKLHKINNEPNIWFALTLVAMVYFRYVFLQRLR